MKSLIEILMELSGEVRKAVEDGYDLLLFVLDGHVFCEKYPNMKYFIAEVEKYPRPCTKIQGNVYRIDLPNGMKGFAIISWKQNNDE